MITFSSICRLDLVTFWKSTYFSRIFELQRRRLPRPIFSPYLFFSGKKWKKKLHIFLTAKNYFFYKNSCILETFDFFGCHMGWIRVFEFSGFDLKFVISESKKNLGLKDSWKSNVSGVSTDSVAEWWLLLRLRGWEGLGDDVLLGYNVLFQSTLIKRIFIENRNSWEVRLSRIFQP